MTVEFIVLFIVVIAGFAGVFWFLGKRLKTHATEPSQDALVLIQKQIDSVTRTLDDRLKESNRMFQDQFGTSAKIIQNVTEKLVKLDETNRQVVNFADQLRNLQDILKNPKQRGILGEYYLETVLR